MGYAFIQLGVFLIVVTVTSTSWKIWTWERRRITNGGLLLIMETSISFLFYIFLNQHISFGSIKLK